MTENLFSYGTLQKEVVQIKLFVRILQGTKDILPNYKISITEIKDEKFLAKGEDKFQKTLTHSSDGSFVEGTVFEVTQAELVQSDKYEPDNYHRIKAALKSGKEAWIYVAG